MDERETLDGKTVYVTTDEGTRGTDGPFYVAYSDPGGNRRYGWYCGNCESFDNAMDTLGRIKCNECGNLRKATEWDPAHE